MYILNIKMNYFKAICCLVVLGLFLFGAIHLLSTDKLVLTSSTLENYDFNVNEDNFVSTLEKIHNSIDENVGKTIKVQGFYYTLADFDKNFFICGRYMVDGNSTKVAGFMSMYDGVMSLEENEWIEVTGKIIKGNYNGEIPVIKVETITKIPAPANMYIEQKNSNH